MGSSTHAGSRVGVLAVAPHSSPKYTLRCVKHHQYIALDCEACVTSAIHGDDVMLVLHAHACDDVINGCDDMLVLTSGGTTGWVFDVPGLCVMLPDSAER